MLKLSEKGHTYAMFAIAVLACALGSLTQTVMNPMLDGVQADFGVEASVSQWLTTIYMLVLGITVPAACALGSLTQTVMNPMLDGVQADFGVEASVSQWLTTIYMLVLGITVPAVTFLAQKMCTRSLMALSLGLFIAGSLVSFVSDCFAVLVAGRVLQAVAAGITLPLVQSISLMALSLGLFIAGSLVSFVSDCFAVLVAGRVLQAVAAGITLPLVQSIAMTRFPPGQNGTAMGIAGIAMGFAPNIGPLIGGSLVDTWGWRSFFIIHMGLAQLLHHPGGHLGGSGACEHGVREA